MRPCHAILVLEKLAEFPRAPLCRKGVELSSDDSLTVMEVYQQWLLLLLDLGYLPQDLGAFERVARRLWIDMIQMDVLDLNDAFSECLMLVRAQSNKGFKGLCKRISTHLYSLIREDVNTIPQGNVFAAKRLMQAFAYTSRLSLQDIDLTQQMLEGYLDTEENMISVTTPFLIQRLNNVIKRWTKSFEPCMLRPKHGKGGVAGHGRVALEDKYKDLSTDQILEYAFGDPTWIVGPYRSTLDRISKTIFVAKSYKTFRTISMEPSTLMYFQQGIWQEIDRMVSRDRYLKARIGFHDQSRNQKLACQGSIARDYATIDLSAASDSVSYDLVKKLFKGTKLLRFIMATRSRRTLLPNGQLLTLKKFAPMGSALCFPVETMIFAAICEIVTREFRVSGRYSVFGDDIIVPTQCVDRTIDILDKLGFRVNHEKSFYRSTDWFRESCGAEYCDGFDVTPLRISRHYADRERDVRIDELKDLANNAYLRQFRHLRAFFLKKLRKDRIVPLFSPTSLLSDNYTNYHTSKRWNRRLQRIDVRVTTQIAKYSREDLDSQDESIRYRHWLESTAERNAPHPYMYADETCRFISVICRPTKLLRESWVAKPYEPIDQGFMDRCLGRSI